MSAQPLDILISNGTVFDGLGSPRRCCDVGIRDGQVVAMGDLSSQPANETIDATGRWVTPGFIDFHTHYDAEVEMAPALFESVRHGVTTVFVGSCSLSAAIGEPEDIADIFCRVEGVPRSVMLPMLKTRKDWDTLPDYLDHLDGLPLGPNVCAFVGHSNIRMVAMGFERSLDKRLRPTADEMAAMEQMLEEGLDAGYLGLSIQTLPWDKLDGDRHRSQPLPSYFARWREYRRLTRILRRRDRIFQGVPNVSTKVNVLLFLWESTGIFRKRLKTTVISLMDVIANRNLWRVVGLLSRFTNRFLRGDFRYQALPNLFDVWSDGMELVVFEEFGAGTEAIHLVDLGHRAELLRDPDYRRRFRKQWTNLFLPRVYHRDFQHSQILGCPDAALVGRSFKEIAEERGEHPVDVFLDLAAEHGDRLRWYSIIGNDRRGPLEKISAHPDVLVGFSDAGAHLRNMAHYNYPLRLLKLVRDAELRGESFMTMERAVFRVTGEPAQWFGIDAGVLQEGRRADVVIINPEALDGRLDEAHEAEMPGFDGLKRLVRRNPETVDAVLVNGRVASREDRARPELGVERGFGRVLRAH